jgi:hypothetical protein
MPAAEGFPPAAALEWANGGQEFYGTQTQK